MRSPFPVSCRDKNKIIVPRVEYSDFQNEILYYKRKFEKCGCNKTITNQHFKKSLKRINGIRINQSHAPDINLLPDIRPIFG